MEFKATLHNLRISPRKVRLVADTVRGKKAQDALSILNHLNKRSAEPLKKLINSAIANASHTSDVLASQLEVASIVVGDGPTIKRFRPRAFGRAFMIRKRNSHVFLTLALSSVAQKRRSKNHKKKQSSDSEKRVDDHTSDSNK